MLTGVGEGGDALNIDHELTYEEKMFIISVVEKRLDSLKKAVISDRINNEKRCPHTKTVNMTTLADPPNIEKRLCVHCRAELTYEDGILIDVEE